VNIDELEAVLSKYPISKPSYKGRDNRSLPFMLSTFRDLIKNEVPPTQEEFILTFREKYGTINYTGLVSRLRRAYLSYVREYHLGFLLKKYFENVVYDETMDLNGIDYLVVYKGQSFNIHAFVNTESSRMWREIKNTRHEFVGNHLDLPLDLSSGKRVGKFILYDDNDILSLKRLMDDFSTSSVHK
jgi:hypothetical protein